ncbi:hypothetical protein Tco_0891796, partial [Tanacetum coccineum]
IAGVIVRFHFPFTGLSGCVDGGGNRLTKTSLITHLRDKHCNGEAQAITKHYLLNDLVVFDRAEFGFVPPPDVGDGVVHFVLYDLTKPLAPSCSQIDQFDGLLHDQDGFTLSLLDSLFSKGLPYEGDLAESSPPMIDLDEGDLDLSERNLKQCKRKIYDGHYTAAVRVLSSSGVAPYNNVTLLELKAKHPFKSAPSLLDTPIDHHHLISSQDVVLDRVKSFPRGTSLLNLFLAGKCPMMLGEYIASAPLTSLVKSGGGISLIAVGTIWRCLVSKVSASMIGHSLDGYLDDLQFGVGVPGGDTLVIEMVLELITVDGPRCGLHLNVDKIEMFWPKEDPRIRFEGVFPPNISRSLHGVKLLGGPISVDFVFSSELVMKRVSKTIGLLDAVFESAQLSFDMALRSALERIVTASGPGFGNWQWRLATLPFSFGGLGVYSVGDVLNYAFLASHLHSAALQTKLLRHVGIVASGPTFDDALLDVPLFSASKSCSACSKVFTCDIYGDHVVSCAGIIGIKHRHNAVRDTLIDICFWSGISAGKEVDIGLDLTGSSPLTQTGMAAFMPGQAMIDVAQCKCGGSGNSRGNRLAISMVVEEKECFVEDKECFRRKKECFRRRERMFRLGDRMFSSKRKNVSSKRKNVSSKRKNAFIEEKGSSKRK